MKEMSNISSKSGIYPAYTDVFKASELRDARFSHPYNFPIFNTANVIPKKLIPFDKIHIVKVDDYDSFVHFFLPDVCFERFWRNPTKYIDHLKKFSGCILPDFSVCYDFPYPLQLYNCYRNRVLGYIIDLNQIPVIMNVSFGDPRSYDFCCDGIMPGGVIAIGSLGTMKNPENRYIFTQGFEHALKVLKPSDLILYGSDSSEIRGICKKYGVKLHLFTPKWNSSFITTEAYCG